MPRLSLSSSLPQLLSLLLLPPLLSCGGGVLADYVVQPLESINTSAHEYAPAFSLDGDRLFFISDMPGGAGGHDCWYATRSDLKGVFYAAPRNLGPPVNTELNEGGITFAPDGTTIYFSACNRPGGSGDCDLYTARMEGVMIREIQNLGPRVNSPMWDSQPSVSSDGRTLYFASNRELPGGGKGSTDIYRTTRDDNDLWSTPVNLGPGINTDHLENAPVISADGTRLYFASNRPEGFGGYDLYVAERKGDEGAWGNPQNLGERFNSERDERSITFTSSGDMACFVSAAAEGNLNLFIALRSAVTHGSESDE